MRPTSEAGIADFLLGAREPVCIQGGGTRNMTVPGEVLETHGVSGITLYEPGALTLVAQAGTPLAEIEAALAAENQHLAFEPADYRPLLGTSGCPTLGAVVVGNISGPRRIQAGAARDFMLGVRFVDGTGTTVKNGGRVMKNVTGYDLVKLMSGAWGTLGILTEVSLKVLPRPETQATLRFHGLSVEQGVRVLSAALGSPFEVTGAAHVPSAQHTLIRIEGFADSVAHRSAALRARLVGFGEAEILNSKSPDIWQAIRDVLAFQDQPGDVWRLSVKPSDAPGLSDRLGARDVILDWGGGLIWALTNPGTDLRSRMGPVAGHATLVRGASETFDKLGRFHPEPAPVARLAEGLRARFDPRSILNTGLMTGGGKGLICKRRLHPNN